MEISEQTYSKQGYSSYEPLSKLLQQPMSYCFSLNPNPDYTAESMPGRQDFWDVAQNPNKKQGTDDMISFKVLQDKTSEPIKLTDH